MTEFLKFIDSLCENFPVHLEIYHSKILDWVITVYKKDCAEDYPESRRRGNDAILCNVQDLDVELCFAKAQVKVKEWLVENNGGY